MFHISLIFLPFIFTILTMTMANPCPCEVNVNDPSNSIRDQLINDEALEEYLDQLATPSTQSGSSSDLYPLFRLRKSLDTIHGRGKRPSWAAVGKRTTAVNTKQPSWAQVG